MIEATCAQDHILASSLVPPMRATSPPVCPSLSLRATVFLCRKSWPEAEETREIHGIAERHIRASRAADMPGFFKREAGSPVGSIGYVSPVRFQAKRGRRSVYARKQQLTECPFGRSEDVWESFRMAIERDTKRNSSILSS